mgnify:CR=1 FL=1
MDKFTPFTQEEVAIAYDLFPAVVEGHAPLARVFFITAPTPRIIALVDGPYGPRAVIDAPFDPNNMYGDSRKGFDVYAGLDPENPRIASIVRVRPLAHCGCGSALRSFQPFATMRHTVPPTPAGPLPAPPLASPAPAPAPATSE